MFRTISNPGRQQRVTLSLESISTIPFQARASNVEMPKLRQHSSNHGMPGFVNVFGTFQGTWDQADKNPDVLLRCKADIFSNITYREIQWPGMLMAPKISQVSLVRCPNDWHHSHSGLTLIWGGPPPIARVRLNVDLTTLRVCKAHQFEIEVCLKMKMC